MFPNSEREMMDYLLIVNLPPSQPPLVSTETFIKRTNDSIIEHVFSFSPLEGAS
jgi:hypothetical protein